MGGGVEIGTNHFEQHGGAKIYFYDEDAIKKEFAEHGLKETRVVTENAVSFLMAVCAKD